MIASRQKAIDQLAGESRSTILHQPGSYLLTRNEIGGKPWVQVAVRPPPPRPIMFDLALCDLEATVVVEHFDSISVGYGRELRAFLYSVDDNGAARATHHVNGIVEMFLALASGCAGP